MSDPFRDDAPTRAERAAALEAERTELLRALQVIRQRRVPHLFSEVRSLLGVGLITIALCAGAILARGYVGPAIQACR